MHYQRWRRTGDPEEVRSAGRPSDAILGKVRTAYGKVWSPRTITRYKRALRIQWWAGGTNDEWLELQRGALRPNGTINVARLERLAEDLLRVAKEEGRLETFSHGGRTHIRKR